MTEEEKAKRQITPPSFWDALIPIGSLIIMLALAVYLFGSDGIGGPIQVALMLCSIIAMLVGRKNGHSMEDMGHAAVEGISTALGAVFILLAVGALVGTWSMSGTIATLVYYGVKIISPDWFYLASVFICAVLAISIGSAWTVAGTVGVGLIGISQALGVSEAVTAGAVISGAYFGDKMSPLSETTNLAPTVAGTDLYTHIKGMTWTAIPSIVIAMALYTFVGLQEEVTSPLDLSVVLKVLDDTYHISALTLIPLLVVLVLSFRKVGAFYTIITGALVGGLMAVILQFGLVLDFVGDSAGNTPVAMIKGVWTTMASGFALETGYQGLDELFSRGGMSSMLETVWLIMMAMAFGGVLEYTGLLARVLQPLVEKANSDKKLVAATGITSVGLNVLAGDQYMAIVLPGRMFRELYQKQGIAPETLSREIEDTGTITSPLIPWNSCGAYMAATLGVATWAYLPFVFFNLINVVVSFAYAIFGIQIRHVEPEKKITEAPDEVALYGIGKRRGKPTTPEDAKPKGELQPA